MGEVGGSIVTTSVVDAPVDRVWASVTSPAGINAGIMPILRMTVPRRFRGRTIADVSAGTHLGRSWFFLFGVLPFDFDDITIAELEIAKGRCRFREQSTMMSMRTWSHDRTVASDESGTRVTDVVHFELRRPLR